VGKGLDKRDKNTHKRLSYISVLFLVQDLVWVLITSSLLDGFGI
jgi:hypothetical protein